MSSDYKELFDTLKQYKDNTLFLDEFIKLIGKVLYDRSSFVKNTDNNDKRDEFFALLKDVIKNNCNNDLMTDSTIFIGEGHTSLVFKMGDNVLKIGKPNSRSLIDRYQDFSTLIPVLYHTDFQVGEREYYSIQISPYVETDTFTDEELYNTYKSLRKTGYIWNDPKSENTGRMISDFDYNGYHYNKGDIVIIDLEDLAYVGEDISDEVLEEIAIASYNPNTYRFETRYISEKGKVL